MGGDRIEFSLPTEDKGRLLVGATLTKEEDQNILLVKVNQKAKPVWKKTIDNGGKETIQVVKKTTDEGFVIGGETIKNESKEVYIIKVNKEGTTQWNKPFREKNLVLYDIVIAMDGDIVIGLDGEKDYILRLDNDGNVIYYKKSNLKNLHHYKEH